MEEPMRHHLLVRLAVALCTVAMLVTLAVGCSVDGVVDLGESSVCETNAVIWVNSQEGGVVTCNGETWSYVQGVQVFPICMDNDNAGFTVGVEAEGETWAEAWVIEEGPEEPAYFFWEWTGETPRPDDWPPELDEPGLHDMEDLTGVYLPWEGSFKAWVLAWIHSPYDD